MKYMDPTQIAKEKEELTILTNQLKKELKKVEQLFEILPSLDKNCICFTNGILHYVSREEVLWRCYNEKEEAWGDWITGEPSFHEFASALEFDDSNIVCVPTTEYYEKLAKRDECDYTDKQIEASKKYTTKVYVYSKNAIALADAMNKEYEEECRKQGKKDVIEKKYEVSGWYVIKPHIKLEDGMYWPFGSWFKLEEECIMYGLIKKPDEAMETAGYDVLYRSVAYSPERKTKETENFAAEMKKGVFPSVGVNLPVNFGWEGACGTTYQAKMCLPEYINELKIKYKNANDRLKEVLQLSALSPEELNQLQQKEKAEKSAQETKKALQQKKKDGFDKYCSTLTRIKWGIRVLFFIVIAIIDGLLGTSNWYLTFILIGIIVAVWFVTGKITDLLIEHKRKKLKLPKG